MVNPLSKKQKETASILWFKDIRNTDVHLVGGKNASLGEMYSKLTEKGIRIPNGFAVTADAYRFTLKTAGLEKKMKNALKELDVTNLKVLRKVGKQVRAMVLKSKLPPSLEKDILTAYRALSEKNGKKNASVAVRSSATAEDLPDASFAGQQETYLNVRGEKALLLAVKRCMASLYNDRAISYRENRGFDHTDVALSVTVQEMVKGDTGTSGVMFSIDTESGFEGVVLVTAAYGLGEYVVQGRVTPDQFYVFKDGLKRGKKAIISKTLGSKQVKLVYGKSGGTKQANVTPRDRHKFCVSEKDVLQLAKWAVMIEEHYGRAQDMEWVKDGRTGKLYIVQARPETVKGRHNHAIIEKYKLKKESDIVLRGIAVGQKIGAGPVRVIESPKHMKLFKKGDVLVTRITDPDWEPIMRLASAIVTEQGGKTSHAAIVSRELGVPCIVGANKARKVLNAGQKVTVSCAKGDEGLVYKGILPFEVQRTEIKEVQDTKTKVMMIVGDPDHAFSLSFLPQDGVGLARLEFIFSNFIRIHPMALVHYDTLKDKRAKKKIREMTRGYAKKTEYCVEKLAEGVGRIAASCYPNDVVVRLSDFKTNEYATLIGGAEFEPKEENPMLGWRGASRYYSKQYEKGFELECKAIKRAREQWGLDNIIPMVPFCRTPEEGQKVIDTMKKYGLTQGEHGLKVYVMCEIPSNVILAREFADIFDGFSIGSNDLTQMTLGMDRDSALVAGIADANNDAVKALIKSVIKVAHEHKKPIGICGQAPSDYPEFAEFLVGEGIDSISLNPDTVVETRRRIAEVEKTIGRKGKKTHKPLLSLVAMLGVMSAGLIGLGAGCASPVDPMSLGDNIAEYVSPALIRERAETGLRDAMAKDRAQEKTSILVDDFADFSLSYPVGWAIHQWRGGVTLKDVETGEYVTVARQLVASPVEKDASEPISIDGVEGRQYKTMLEDGREVTIVELKYKGEDIEISGYTDRFQDIFATLDFVTSTSPDVSDDRPLNEWDVKEGRLCAQVITFARQEAGECVAYPTPCDVPEGWRVCE